MHFSESGLVTQFGKIESETTWHKQRQEDDEDGDEEENSFFVVFDIRLSQLTCKIFETGTNANSADLLATQKKKEEKKNPHGFSNELSLTMVGCPELVNIRSGL